MLHPSTPVISLQACSLSDRNRHAHFNPSYLMHSAPGPKHHPDTKAVDACTYSAQRAFANEGTTEALSAKRKEQGLGERMEK